MQPVENIHMHGSIIQNFIIYLNNNSKQYALKGGTALLLCYKLDRFSEDLDFNGRNKTEMYRIVVAFCKQHNFRYNVKKDTSSVFRIMIRYSDNTNSILKIEVSFRDRNYINNTTYINGILTYNIDTLFNTKLNAGGSRNKIRDIYDLLFIITNYTSYVAYNNKAKFNNLIANKFTIDYVTTLIETQSNKLFTANAVKILEDRYLYYVGSL